MLILVGITIILHLITLRERRKRVVRFSNFETLQRLVGEKMFQNDYIILILRVLGIIFIVLGISNFTITMVGNISDFDFVLAIDTSSSMSTGDFVPNRLGAAKDTSLYLLKLVPNDTKIGVVTFSGKAYKKIGLTNNFNKLREVIENLTFETPAGTAISDALLMSTTILSESNKTKAIILLTDGKNNVGMPINESVQFLRRNNITVYAIGIGTNTTINQTGLNISEEIKGGSLAESPVLDISSLKYITNNTQGKFFLAKNRTAMKKAFENTVIERKEKKIDISHYLLLAGLACFLIEWMLGATKYKTIP